MLELKSEEGFVKVLIISMTCGEGHNYIAKAIKKELDEKKEDSKIIQLYGFSEKEVQRQNNLFLSACKYVPHIYEQIWLRLRKRNPKKQSSVINGIIKDCKNYILKEIEDYQPDKIICTHNNAGAVINYLKNTNQLSKDIKTYAVAFDYCLCPYWESCVNLDYVITPHEFTHPSYIERGFNENQLLPYGLPVDEKYTKKLDKKEARKTLGLKEDMFTIALYSGGNCLSKASTLIKTLIKSKLPIQIISICGKNKKEFEKINKYIQKNNLTNILNIGFCTNLDVVYSASDVVFSRGGGMGLTEQINKNVPFILREGLIINERINKKMFNDMGVGKAMHKLKDAPKILKELIENKQLLQEMSKKAKELCKPNSTKEFVNFLLK